MYYSNGQVNMYIYGIYSSSTPYRPAQGHRPHSTQGSEGSGNCHGGRNLTLKSAQRGEGLRVC